MGHRTKTALARTLLLALGLSAALAAQAQAQQDISQSSHPVTVLPFSLLSSGFAASGAEAEVQNGDKKLLSSLGLSGVGKMKGANFELGTGVVGGIVPSQGNLSKAHAFPNPYIPSRGHAGITFSQVTAQATIRVYTINGERVKELSKNSSGSDRVSWLPVNNEQGQPVASGLYLFEIFSPDGQVKTGKLMIIK